MTNKLEIDATPAPPFRPLPKIVARPKLGREQSDQLHVGDRVHIKISEGQSVPFWRLYEVTLIDGETCRLVTPNKRFAMNGKTALVKELRDLQRRLTS